MDHMFNYLVISDGGLATEP